jgi:hypothetical protein
VVIAALSFAVPVAACSPTDADDSVAEAVAPAPWDLSTPESAVRSYLEWVSFSYRMANSDIPTATLTPAEGVRVDSYIQLNRMDGKGIEQAIESFEVRAVDEAPDSAIVTARESWRYRYFSLETLTYVSDLLRASYDSTYTLVPADEGWIVDRVEVTPLGEVQ